MPSDLDALRSLFMPATQRVAVNAPATRRRKCAKCPFNRNLDDAEKLAASAVIERLRANPAIVWGCHETVNGSAPQVCAGFAAWKGKQA